MLTKDNLILMVISKQETLENGNKKFTINNYNKQPIMFIEENTDNKIGNRKLFKNKSTSFETNSKFLLPTIENA